MRGEAHIIAKNPHFYYNKCTMLKNFPKQPVIYVSRDLERAIALSSQKHYYIISNGSPFAKRLQKSNPNIILVSKPKLLDTHELLEQPKIKKFINSLPDRQLMVFKNTALIEKICDKNNWTLLNPSARLAAAVEEKISQLEWLSDLQKFLPPHQVMQGKNLEWKNENFIAQFNRAHTGSGTMLIKSKSDVEEIRNKFPERPIRVTKFIEGPAFTSNNIVWGGKILPGPIMYQITGLAPFTQNRFATIGNDWELPNKLLNKSQKESYQKIVEEVGIKLAHDGWKGLFGIDAILDSKTGIMHLIEINARQPASTTYESQLQKTNTTFEAHLSALLGLPNTNFTLTSVSNGSQIIQRVPADGALTDIKKKIKKLEKLDLNVILYTNKEPETDLLRIQSKKGIMLANNQFDELGEKIKIILD